MEELLRSAVTIFLFILILGGLVLPAVVLLPLIAYAMIAGERLLPLPGQSPARIEAIGRQWTWTFRYPDHGATETRGVLHMPAGAPVDILVSSRDVIHAFWIPRLAGACGSMSLFIVRRSSPQRWRGQQHQKDRRRNE